MNTEQYIFEKPFRDFFRFFRMISLLPAGGFGLISFAAWKSALAAETSERGFPVIMAGISTIVTVIFLLLFLKQDVRTQRFLSLRYSIWDDVLQVWNKRNHYQLDLKKPIYSANITIPFYYGKTVTSFTFTVLSDHPVKNNICTKYGTDAIWDIINQNSIILSTSIANKFLES